MNAVGTTPTASKGYSPLDCVAGVGRKLRSGMADVRWRWRTQTHGARRPTGMRASSARSHIRVQ